MSQTDIIEGEVRPLAVRDEMEPQQNLALFGTNDPVAVIASATRVADALKAVVVKKNLVSVIQGKEYPQVEAWQTLAVMLGLAAVCEWTRQVEDGWEARVIVQRHGQTIAAAEAQCLRTERTKKGWEDYAIRSMAQTRATSKSLRSVLGFVMVLAGYQATPAEEMPGDTTPPPPSKAAPKTTDDRRKDLIKAIHVLCTERGISRNLYLSTLLELFGDERFAANEGTPTSKLLNVEELQTVFSTLSERTASDG